MRSPPAPWPLWLSWLSTKTRALPLAIIPNTKHNKVIKLGLDWFERNSVPMLLGFNYMMPWSSVLPSIQNVNGQQNWCLKILTRPGILTGPSRKIWLYKELQDLSMALDSRTGGGPILPARQKSYQKLCAGPLCISYDAMKFLLTWSFIDDYIKKIDSFLNYFILIESA